MSSLQKSQNDYVGRPSNSSDQSSAYGSGQRQSVWAFEFTSGQNWKSKSDATWLTINDGKDMEVDIHYLDQNAAATVAVTIFGVVQTPINVGSTDDWIIKTYSIPSAVVAADSDGAHIICTPSGAFVRFHMAEMRLA